jgi:hypothetical protein
MMPGNMPFHLEKGPLGLRMDYLAKIDEVRSNVLDRIRGTQLQQPEDFWLVARSISANGVEINLLEDDRNVFSAKLNQLSPGAGDAYLVEQALLRPFNRDSTGNRNRFVAFWEGRKGNAELMAAIRQAVITSLESTSELDVWWECTLRDNPPSEPAVAVSTELPEVTRLMFRTDHSPVVPEPLDMLAHTPDP